MCLETCTFLKLGIWQVAPIYGLGSNRPVEQGEYRAFSLFLLGSWREIEIEVSASHSFVVWILLRNFFCEHQSSLLHTDHLYFNNFRVRKTLPGVLQNLLLLLFSHLAMSNSLWPHGLQHARPPCLSPSPNMCSSSCPLHQWCHPGSSSSEALFSFCSQFFPASGDFSS